MTDESADRGDPTPSIPQHSSKSNEHYTPTPITSVARLTLGSIDLDPASCEIANRETVKAAHYLTERGIEQKWNLHTPWPKVFCNPPGGFVPGTRRSQAQAFYFKAVQEWMANRIEACVFLGFTLELLRLSQRNPVLPGASRFPFCLLADRTDFLIEQDGQLVVQGSPTHANVLILISDDSKMVERFQNYAEANLGDVVVPRSRARRIGPVT